MALIAADVRVLGDTRVCMNIQGHASYRAVDAHDGGNAGEVMNRPK
jgi:hypothetical protein